MKPNFVKRFEVWRGGRPVDKFEAMLIIFVTFFLIAAAALVIDVATSRTGLYYETIEIVTISDNSFTSGSFILGSGYISGDPVYTSYAKDSDGSLYQLNLRVEKSHLYLDENEHPYVKITYGKEFGGIFGGEIYRYIQRYDFHIPEDSIVRDFNLDSEI